MVSFIRQTVGEISHHDDLNQLQVVLEQLTAYTAKTADYAITATDHMVAADTSAGSFTLTLPSAVAFGAGNSLAISKTDVLANVLSIATVSAQTVDGLTTVSLYGRVGITLTSNGANWIVTSGKQFVNPERINVRWFGAKGDDANDDTTPILTAFSLSTSTVRKHIVFPAGVYKITAALNLPFSPGMMISGAGRGGTIIKQYTNNVPILRSAENTNHSITITDLQLYYVTQQTTSDTDAYAIQWDFGAASSTQYGWVIDRVYIFQAYTGIGIKGTAGYTLPIWDLLIENCTIQWSVKNGIDLVAPVTTGQPNILLRNLYILNTGGGPVPTGSAIHISGATQGAVLENIDIEGWSDNCIQLTGHAAPVIIRGLHIESCTWTTAANQYMILAANGGVIIEGGSVQGTVNKAGGTCYFLYANVGGDCHVTGVVLNLTLTAGTAVFALADTLTTLWIQSIKDVNSNVTIPISATHANSVAALRQYNTHIQQQILSKTAAYTATITDDLILCDATSGAFTVTLPAAAGKLGMMVTIKKTDASANAVTVDGNASETIDGATTYVLATQHKYVTIVVTTTSWHVVANN